MDNMTLIPDTHYKINDQSGCWEWLMYKNPNGYGQKCYNNKVWLAHRLSYYLLKGEFNLKHHVLHRCDKPACINPDHLFLGTQQDNVADMYKKGRAATEFKLPHCKISNKDVKEMRDSYEKGLTTQQELADKHNVKLNTINRIVNYKRRINVR